MEATFRCVDCGEEKPVEKEGGTGYGVDKDDNKVCYACCAERDKKDMEETGKAVLYLKTDLWQGGNRTRRCSGTVSNWPGTLKFEAYVRTGGHNIAGVRYDAYFRDHRGHEWHGVTYGNNTKICHCNRLKQRK
jgi:hypothetical protein